LALKPGNAIPKRGGAVANLLKSFTTPKNEKQEWRTEIQP
jgi:hypothetical protein